MLEQWTVAKKNGSFQSDRALILHEEELELELELIQIHMAQKPMLRVEVGSRALRVRSVSREEAWASAGVQGAWVSGWNPGFLRYFFRRQLHLYLRGLSPQNLTRNLAKICPVACSCQESDDPASGQL